MRDVDFMRRTVRIEWQLAPGSKLRSAPKTTRSTRTVPLPQVVAEALSMHLAEFSPGDEGRCSRPGLERLVGMITTRRASSAPASKAGLPAGTTSHDLRHHNAALVLSTYGHLMPDSEDRTRRDRQCSVAMCPPVPREGNAAL